MDGREWDNIVVIVDSGAQWGEISRYDRARDVEGVGVSARRLGVMTCLKG